MVPNGEVLRIAEILDRAGFALPRGLGRRCLRRRRRAASRAPGSASAPSTHATTTPLGIALRGRFLVGASPSRPTSSSASSRCAAENGIDVFRLHDPLNDVSTSERPARRSSEPARPFTPASSTARAPGREHDALVEQAQQAPATSERRGVLVNDPTGALLPHSRRSSPSGSARRAAFRSALRPGGGRDRAPERPRRDTRRRGLVARRLSARAHAPPDLRRVTRRSARTASGATRESDVGRLGRPPTRSTSTSATSRSPRSRRGSRCARPSTTSRPALSPRSTSTCAACAGGPPARHARGGRPDPRGVGLAAARCAPIGQILGSQALLNVLSARRYGTVLDEFRSS